MKRIAQTSIEYLLMIVAVLVIVGMLLVFSQSQSVNTNQIPEGSTLIDGGIGGACSITCPDIATGVSGCFASQPTDSVLTADDCCSSDSCYSCPAGTSWDAGTSSCVAACSITCPDIATGVSGCFASQPIDSAPATGECCSLGSCYSCPAGTSWDIGTSSCVAACSITCPDIATSVSGCFASQPIDSAPATGDCCSSDSCYSCPTGTSWDAGTSSCIVDTVYEPHDHVTCWHDLYGEFGPPENYDDLWWIDSNGEPTEIYEVCERKVLEYGTPGQKPIEGTPYHYNGGLTCGEFGWVTEYLCTGGSCMKSREPTCCPTGYVSINGWCVPVEPEGKPCYADNQCYYPMDCEPPTGAPSGDRVCDCDSDDDGYRAEGVACGGDDCKDRGIVNGIWDYYINPGVVEETDLCLNNVDDDCDGLSDCADPDCQANPRFSAETGSRCNGGVDDDCDGLIDCADPDCVGSSWCT